MPKYLDIPIFRVAKYSNSANIRAANLNVPDAEQTLPKCNFHLFKHYL